MLLEPTVIVLYVDNIAISSRFYQGLLGISPEEASITFHSFTLSKGMSLALKAKHAVTPPIEQTNGHGELAFILDTCQEVDELCAQWRTKGITIILSPTALPYGYTFVALDPDGHRLRVISISKPD